VTPAIPRPRGGFPRARNVAAALACFLAAKLGLLLAIPPGYASAVQPLAGIALAAVLVLGPETWPGIALGACAACLGIDFRTGSAVAVLGSFGVPLTIGAGAAAQALVGAHLLRRFAAFPNALTEAPEVLRFLALGGPASGWIGATSGALALLVTGRIPQADFGFEWCVWFMGSSAGAALFGPLALLWVPSPSPPRLRRRLSVTAPLGLILALAVFLFFQVRAREREQLSAEFERRADELAHGLLRGFDGSLEVLDSLGSFYDASHRIDRREFGTFARSALSRHPSVRALAWSPRVKDGERSGCIRSARLEVDPAYSIRERDAEGALVPAAKRDEYVPVYYLEAREETPRPLGLDALADPVCRAALEGARDRGDAEATAPLDFAPGSPGLVVYRPVFGPGEGHATQAERRTSLVGYASAEFGIVDLLREALQGMETGGVRVELSDVTDAQKVRVLCSLPKGASGATAAPADREGAIPPRTARYRIGSRAFEFRFVPGAGDSPVRHAWQSWCVLAAGLLFTGLLEAFLLVVSGRTDAIEELVARRTSELSKANEDLRHQVAERARAEAQHESSERRLAAAQQIAHLGSWELDIATSTVLLSDELCRIHGLPPAAGPVSYDEFLGRVHPDDREIFAHTIEQAVRELNPFTRDHRILRPDSEVRIVQGRGEVLVGPDGRATRIHGTGQDVTDLKRAERELARRTVDLERSNAELERFAYVASHDLQEPLRAVASHVQILEQDYRGRLGADADLSIRCAVEGAQRMHALINDYLAYSRVRSGPETLQPTSSDEALGAALLNLRQALRESSAEVTHDAMPDVLADATGLVQLFQNLIGNSVKFRRDEPPKIHVSAARADTMWLFSVVDNGIGIDPEHSGRIFSLFQRLHTQDRYPGTGIGLAICKKIVDHHGGRIWVESMPGMGATFRFTLPVCPEEPDRTEDGAVETAGTAAGGAAGGSA
jgi:PAS domain S-box-containing protein